MKDRLISLLNYIFQLIIIAGIAFIVYYFFDLYQSNQIIEESYGDPIIIEDIGPQEPTIIDIGEDQNDTEPIILPQYESLYEANSDLCGWITIPDTGVDYPIMCTPDDPEYYLRKNINGEYSIRGTPFIGKESTIDDKAIIIYGHMMKDHTMFGDLKYYLDENYFNNHLSLHINTLYEEREFEVVGVFRSWVHTKDEPGYRFYYYYGNPTEEEFNDYKEYLKENCIYSHDLDSLSYDDTTVQLVTCSYHRENGRLIIVAKEKERS